ncbi:MAG: WG repeat-containing protein [Bryobacteraceae bacterium]
MSSLSNAAAIRAVAWLLFAVCLIQPVLPQSRVPVSQGQPPKQQNPPGTVSQALRDLTTNAEAGDARAQLRLGKLSATGTGVPESDSDAVKWYRLAAEQGLAEAQYLLAGRYSSGRGVPQDYAQALYWTSVAAVNSNDENTQTLGYYAAGKLTMAQVAPVRSSVAGEDSRTLDLPWLQVRNKRQANIAPDRHDDAQTVAGKWGYVDRNGNLIVEPQFDDRKHFSDGLAAVKLEAKWGFIDTAGRFAIAPRFVGVSSLSGGLAGVRVQKNGDWGFIGRDGRFAIEPRFSDVLDESWFSEGLAVVAMRRGGPLYYIEATG